MVAKKPITKPSTLRLPDAGGGGGGGDVMDDWAKKQQLLKPDDQEDLPEAGGDKLQDRFPQLLKDEVGRLLISQDPHAPLNVIEFSWKAGQFVKVQAAFPTFLLYQTEAYAILKESPEAQAQIAAGDWDGGDDAATVKKAAKRGSDAEEGGAADQEGEEGDEGDQEGEEEHEEGEDAEGEEGGEVVLEAAAAKPPPKKTKKLPNAFNFCENAALTYNNPNREMTTQTVTLPSGTSSGLISPYIIYDFYAEDFDKHQKEKEKETKKPAPLGGKKEVVLDKKKLEAMMQEAIQKKTFEAAKKLDRMICQNLYDEISQDYRYYEDPSDDYRNQEGTLLPLWKFCYEKTKKNAVTDIQWNPRYYDLMSVTLGSYDFTKQPVPGALALFTLKNPSYPEYVRLTESSALCVSIHPRETSFNVVGFYNGCIAVYNSMLNEKTPQYQSNPLLAKHNGPVAQVKWGVDMRDGELNMYSVGPDGFVYNWIIVQAEIVCTTVIRLTLPIESVLGPDGAVTQISASGSTFCFHPLNPRIYMVGTEAGKIFKCCVNYSYKYMFTYEAHEMPVYKISFNRFYPKIFLSCSADWTVKIWEDGRAAPLFVFDLGMCVGDAQWAPYSSTVLAALTTDGKCHVFDLNVNKYRAICTQNVISKKNKNKSNRMRFNYKMPIIVAGDERGTITTIKLSPNLRVKPKPPKKKEGIPADARTLEIMKLEKILAVMIEDVVLKHPPDIESIKFEG